MTVTLDLTPGTSSSKRWPKGCRWGLPVQRDRGGRGAGIFGAAMDELARGLDDVPVLAPEALTREAIYGHRG